MQSGIPGAVWTKKTKENFSVQPQEQRIKSPQPTWCTLYLWNTWRQRIILKLRRWTLGATVHLGFAVCNWIVSDLYVYLSLVFSSYYHWWICLLLWLLPFFIFLLFYFNNFFWFFILIILLYFSFFLFSLSFWAMWLTGCWCSGLVLGLRLWGGKAEFRTLDHQRPPGPMRYQLVRALPDISFSTLRLSSAQWPASSSAGHPMPNN